ncbi:GntR family transcriptional regulator [Verticiella sediminum]|uniref:GntR family transcriptional regulator n=1 Tax=Verticiella sediminum TaxID=1247510 RepID=A0A556AGA3_9BURK|nr:GntR family transcriptional regulator [Verticiella sediminum]TSH91903.1 GntR family transcriptional regulator [Verticiella sediminum]
MRILDTPDIPDWHRLAEDWRRHIPPPRPVARTIPEQIADDLGAALVAGQYGDGERLPEQELADAFRVSRGPVREALRLLERRGLVSVVPRRGAQARGVTLAAIADLFNVRTALCALGARQAALVGEQAYCDTLERRIEDMQSHEEDDSLAVRFATDTSRAARTVVAASHNVPAIQLMAELSEQTVWRVIWTYPLDYRTRQRRLEHKSLYRQLHGALLAGDPDAAEHYMRRTLESTRDSAIETLSKLRGEQVPADRLPHTA